MSAYSGYALAKRLKEKPSRVPETLRYRLAILDRARKELQSQLERIERESRELRNTLAEIEA
jgi:prefoldin subunit 5